MSSTKVLRFQFLRASHVKIFNQSVEGTASNVNDENMLESAVNSPLSQEHYGQEKDLARLAAALSYKLIKNHAFANGNKRTAQLAANSFLALHGKMLQESVFAVEDNDKLTKAHIGVATDEVEEGELAEVYRSLWKDATGAISTQAVELLGKEKE